jgi:hypothetical protein
MEEYLTVDELGARIKFSRQSLYNLIHRGTFILGKHYLKPTPKKILFKWSEIKVWMGEPTSPVVKNNSCGTENSDSLRLSSPKKDIHLSSIKI